jgi:hypothetical protein
VTPDETTRADTDLKHIQSIWGNICSDLRPVDNVATPSSVISHGTCPVALVVSRSHLFGGQLKPPSGSVERSRWFEHGLKWEGVFTSSIVPAEVGQ